MPINQIKEMRLRKRITQVELANKLGVTQGTVQKMETGKSVVTLDWLEKLAKALDCEPYELLPEEWQPQPLTEEEKILLAMFRRKGQE